MEEALQSGKPCTSREETISALKSLCTGSRAPLLVSDVPLGIKKTSKVVMGIDEAGRGPLLGPMVYAAAYWDKNDSELIPKGLADSKVLSSATRTALLEDIQSTDKIGFVVRVLHAYEISSNMLRKEPYNLNAMSHDAAMQMIRSVLEAGVNINTCYIDTVGPPESYKAKLEREFEGHNISFIVEKKADAKYTCCSAASVVAKVVRDSVIESWQWSEIGYEPEDGINYGSGYPADPKCKAWMEKNLIDPYFCYPDIMRFSWAPIKNIITDRGCHIEWEAEEEDEGSDEVDPKQMSMQSFLVFKSHTEASSKPSALKKQRLGYFEKNEISIIDGLQDL